jgi:serine/threonine protein kinase
MSSLPEEPLASDQTTVLPTAPMPGSGPPDAFPQLGEFEIIRKLGEGAYGQVFLARQGSLDRQVALKLSRGHSKGRTEGQLLAGLEHDHIVKVFSEFHDPHSDTQGLCLQYVPGANLGVVISQLHKSGRRPPSGQAILSAIDAHRQGEAKFDPAALRDRDALAGDTFPQAVCRIGARLAEALAFAHARGILHCDIKPANILITPYGRPMLADFNVAFDLSRDQAAQGYGGTIAYTSPEHYAALHGLPGGKVDEPCDVYSLGVVLQELATGRRPKPAGHPASAEAADEGHSLDGIPHELAGVIRRCLEANPARRYHSAAELATALMGAWHLLAARRTLPRPGRIDRLVIEHPIPALAAAVCVPHLAASVVNIAYNAVQIQLDDAQQKTFAMLVVVYNAIAYPILLGTGGFLLLRLRRLFAERAGPAIDQARRAAVRLGWWTIGLGVLGWFPGGVIFPLVIDLISGPLPWGTYAHYMVSFLLAGLIGVVFCYLITEYILLRAMIPRLGNPDRYVPGGMWSEIGPLTVPFAPFLLLACAVPLTGAVLLVAFADGVMTLGFRMLVAGLIGLGVAGVGIAERLTRKLRSLVSVWERECPDAAGESGDC